MGVGSGLMLLARGWVGVRGALDKSGGGGGTVDCCDGLGLLAGEEATGDVAGGACEGAGFALIVGAADLELKKPPPETVMTVEVVKSVARAWVVGAGKAHSRI
jgi:hypothetical protein